MYDGRRGDALLGLELAVAAMSWQRDGLCTEPAYVDSVEFFPERGESTDEAKTVCARCIVRAECLDYAITEDIDVGVWGGTSARERRILTTGRKPAAKPLQPLCGGCGGRLPKGRVSEWCADCEHAQPRAA